MLTVTEARERILAHFSPAATETIPLAACVNRVLGVDIAADHDHPPFDNSAVDGFAVRAEDTPASRLRVVADIPAGTSPTATLKPGEAARIMTGAQLPEGANAVIPVEDTDFKNRQAGTPAPETVSLDKKLKAGENVRARGMDIRTGEVVLQKGRTLKPQDLGLLAALGMANVIVYKKPRAALLSSGDELLPVEAPLEPGKIRDSNSYTIAALIENAGADVLRLGVARDTREAVTSLLDRAVSEGADLILSTAGVSVGAFDFIKEVIESNGRMDFWRVNMRPGKPLAFGKYRDVNFIGLPGNPVSAFVGFEVFVRPSLERMSGKMDGGRQTVRVRCAEEIESDGRESYLRAKIRVEDGIRIASLTGHQGSGNLLSLVQADALLIIPAGVKCVPAGQEVDAFLL
ncbi:MAG: molybdopterin molybdenumtransferase MoeA [Chloroflexi bacterium]|nr:molybdopterin molybdenumtransferase MoeA [Chloroflexota bacterium]MDL1943683.1 molybdopterin molybdotransferase MoeA [Chloroflexi bacterium CFX2]